MTTSGDIDFTLTARDIIAFALDKIAVVPIGGDPSDAQIARCAVELNMMLKGWQKYTSLWRMTEASFPLVAGTAVYTLTPSPHKVISLRYRNTSGIDLPIDELSRSEYYDLPNKTATGIPHSYYPDYQRTAVTVTLWQPMVSVTTESIQYTYQRKFENVGSINNELDVKSESLEVVGYNLALRIAPRYPNATKMMGEVKEQAIRLREEMLDDDREDYVRMVPTYNERAW